MRVLVTNAKNRIAYNVVRSLGKKGIDVYTVDFIRNAMSFASKYSKGYAIIPSPFSDAQEFIEKLLETIKKFKIDVLIPVLEETFLISKHMDIFKEKVKVVLPDYKHILLAHNKNQWDAVARKLGIPVPKSISADDIRNGKHKVSDFNFPILIKPKQGGGGWGIRRIYSDEELSNLLKNPKNINLEWGRFFIQEFIDGETICIAVLMNRGKMRAKIAYKQLRDYPVSGGQATARISVRSETAESLIKNMLEALNWHGVCQVDFIIEKKSGLPYLIDMNPRLWGSITQAIASGVDFPYLIYKIAVDGDVDPVKKYKIGVTTRWIGGDLRTFIPTLRNSSDKVAFFKDYLCPFTKPTLYDDFSWNDPLPFLLWSMDAIMKIIKFRTIVPVQHDSLDGIWE